MVALLPLVILIVIVLVLMNKATGGVVCPFCGGGPLRRAFEKTECTQCGKLFYRWQARRK
jgi:hypothetical protein